MFANAQFTHKNAPVFVDSARYASEGEGIYTSALRPSIMNDEDAPPKALIELDMFLIPIDDYKDGEKWKKEYYDLTGSVCLTPEHAIKLVRHLNRLISEIFNDHNYVNDSVKAKLRRYKKRQKYKGKSKKLNLLPAPSYGRQALVPPLIKGGMIFYLTIFSQLFYKLYYRKYFFGGFAFERAAPFLPPRPAEAGHPS